MPTDKNEQSWCNTATFIEIYFLDLLDAFILHCNVPPEVTPRWPGLLNVQS